MGSPFSPYIPAKVPTILSNFLLTPNPPTRLSVRSFRIRFISRSTPSMAALPKRRSCFTYDEDDEYDFQLSRSPIWFQSRSYFHDGRSENHHRRQPHFLDSCFLCRKSLVGDNDIFMYRGDTPFCSEECRAEQIEMDEAKEKHRNVSSAMRAGVEKSLNSNNKAESYSFRTGTIVAA